MIAEIVAVGLSAAVSGAGLAHVVHTRRQPAVADHPQLPHLCGSHIPGEIEHWCRHGRGHDGIHECGSCDVTWPRAVE